MTSKPSPRRSAYPNLQPQSRPSAPRRSSGGMLEFLTEKVALFRRVPPNVILELVRCASERRYVAGDYVCHTGDPAREIWVVKSGRLTVNQCGWSGSRLSVEVMVPGDVSGLASVACQTYPGEVVASRDSTLIILPREAVVRCLEKHPILAREILYAYGQRIQYIETLLNLSREKVGKRIVASILYLFHKFGFVLPLSRAEIGEMAGTTPETAIRVIKALERRGLVNGTRGAVTIVDLAGLKTELDRS
jgi:CRP/FNR family transcriptional regulator